MSCFNLGLMQRKRPIRKKSVTWQEQYQDPHDLNIRGVYLHILEHFLTSLIVIISAVIVMFFKGRWTLYVDPALSIMVVAIILYSLLPMFKQALILFLQTVPANLKVTELEERLKVKVPHVLSVHEFHVWQMGGDHVVGEFDYLTSKGADLVPNCR